MAEYLGDDYVLALDTASPQSYSSPTWTKQCSVGDIQFDFQNENVEVKKRCGNKAYRKGRSDWKLSFSMNFDPDNTFHVAVRDAIRTGSKIHLALFEGPIASGDSYHAWWLLSGPLDASLDTSATWAVEAMPHTDMGAADAEAPAYVAAT